MQVQEKTAAAAVKQPINKTLRLTESAVMIAISTVLSLLPLFQMPQGGDVTVCTLLPLAIVAYRYGVKWGVATSLVYGVIQLMLGLSNLSYVKSITSIIVVILFDYIVAYGFAGFSGMFRNKVKNQGLSITLGLIVATILRYLCHVVSGFVVWGEWAEGTWLTAICEKLHIVSDSMVVLIYSLGYNSFVFVDSAIAIAVALIFSAIFNIKDQKIKVNKR